LDVSLVRSVMDNDFDNVTWQNESDSEAVSTPYDEASSSSRPAAAERQPSNASLQAGPHADAVDLAGIEEGGRLDCSVETPLKEGDGNNAYISYLVTTQVCLTLRY
jgi:sorting nexin-4